MKKIFITMMLVLACSMPTSAKTPKMPSGVYPHMAMVTKVKRSKKKGKKVNLIFAVDGAGREWSFYNKTEYWVKGDFVAFNLYNNGTPNYIYDDIIVGEPQYVGFAELFN